MTAHWSRSHSPHRTAPSCTGTHGFGDLCTGFSGIRFRVDCVTDGVALEWWSNLVGADLLVEAYEDGEGALVGRAFARRHTDVAGPAVCLPPVAIDLRGELVIDALSEEGPIAAVVFLETDTATMTIPF